MIKWQSTTAPYLQSGNKMYEEMRQSYKSGAEYIIVFNYTPDNNSPGVNQNRTSPDTSDNLLQDEPFAAIQKLWTDIVQNSDKTNNVAAEWVCETQVTTYGDGGNPTTGHRKSGMPCRHVLQNTAQR